MRKLTVFSFMLLGSLSAVAAPITYTISGIGSGQEFTPFPNNQTAFSNLPFSFTLMANTTEIIPSLGASYVLGDSTLLTLGGVEGTVAGDALLLYNNGTIGLLNDTGVSGGGVFYNTTINLSSPDLIGFSRTSTIGPIDVSFVLNPEERIEGSLILSSAEDVIFTSVSDITFSASTSSSATPEPAAFALIGMGLIVLSLFRWKWRLHKVQD